MRYSETLDEVYELTHKYSTQGTVIWPGDLNGSLEAKGIIGTNFSNYIVVMLDMCRYI